MLNVLEKVIFWAFLSKAELLQLTTIIPAYLTYSKTSHSTAIHLLEMYVMIPDYQEHHQPALVSFWLGNSRPSTSLFVSTLDGPHLIG